MPKFTVWQFYTARESFHVEAPDANTAVEWMTEGGPPEYPGDRDDDEYLDVIGHEVYDDGGDIPILDTTKRGTVHNPLMIEGDTIDWRPVGEGMDADNPRCRLKANLEIGQVSMHLEALQVDEDRSRILGINPEIDHMICGIYATTGADKPFETIVIEGKHYVLLATPYCT
jgi:hypothetical protein